MLWWHWPCPPWRPSTWRFRRRSSPIRACRGGTRADLARHAGWAPRTLARQFAAQTGMAPLRWITAARIREARRLLEATDLPVEVIAARCGLGTAANLRLHLARDAGATPTAYRAAYQGRPADASEAES
jgi:transcriptional regulator GlxA family with amidase domain